jgi:hypothetical protein
MSTKVETMAACQGMLSSMPAWRMLGSYITCTAQVGAIDVGIT